MSFRPKISNYYVYDMLVKVNFVVNLGCVLSTGLAVLILFNYMYVKHKFCYVHLHVV